MHHRTSSALPPELQLSKSEILTLLDMVRAAKVDACVQLPAAGVAHIRPAVLWKLTPLLADLMTMTERFDGRVEDITCCYVGDGRTQAAAGLLVVGARLGMDIRIAAPRHLWPAEAYLDAAEDIAADSGARLLVTSDAGHAVLGADFICTDGWLQLIEWPEARAEHLEMLEPFRVTTDMVMSTGKLGTKVLHRRPWRLQPWGERTPMFVDQSGATPEIAPDVVASPACLVDEQEWNRVCATLAFSAARHADTPPARAGELRVLSR